MQGKPRELFPGGTRPPGKKSRPKPGLQEHEILMRYHLQELKLHAFFDYRFHDRYRWKFDFAVPDHMLALEIEGGAWGFDDGHGNKIMGAHSRGEGYYKDCYKYREAAILGWAVLRFSVEEVKTAVDKVVISRWLKAKAQGFRPEI